MIGLFQPPGTFPAVLGVVAILLAGCGDATRDRRTIGAERDCPASQGSGPITWADFYQRGVCLADRGLWQRAESALRSAVEQWPCDQRRARPYGMWRIEYFPHRELGVVLYRQGRLEEAGRELETSLETEISARAEVFLDRVRRGLLAGLDRSPPRIQIASPDNGTRVRAFTVHVRGEVWDDHFVKAIRVNGHPVRIDLGRPHVAFELDVPLPCTGDRIRVEADDLVGNPCPKEVRIRVEAEDIVGNLARLAENEEVLVTVDREGPVIGIREARPGGRLRGYVDDPSGLAEVRIDGRPQHLPESGGLRLDQPLPTLSEAPRLVIEATDRAGNRTLADIDFTAHADARLAPLRFAATAGVPAPAADGAADGYLETNYRTDSGAVYLDNIDLQAQVTLSGGVDSVTVNGVEMQKQPEPTVFIHQHLALVPGENRLHVEARGIRGQALSRTITLTRKLKQLERREERYRLALLGKRPANAGHIKRIWTVLKDKAPRFSPTGSGPLDASLSSPPRTAQDVGQLVSANHAHGVLWTRVHSSATSLTYEGEWIDARGKTLFDLEAYADEGTEAGTGGGENGACPDPAPDKDPDQRGRGRHHYQTTRRACVPATLLYAARDVLPVLQGRVRRSQGRVLLLDLDGGNGLPQGLPLALYREREPRRDARNGTDLGADQWVLGEARLDDPQGPVAELLSPSSPVAAGDRVEIR